MNSGTAGYCPECGTQAVPGQRFCKECGTTLPAQSVAPLSAPGMPTQQAAPYARGLRASSVGVPIGEIIVAICSLIVLILSTIPWYKVTDKYEPSYFAYQKVWPQLPVLIFSLLLLIFAIVMIIDRYINVLPEFNAWPFYVFTALLILVFAILPTFVKPTEYTYYGISELVSESDILTLRWGYFITSLLFIIGILIGGMVSASERR